MSRGRPKLVMTHRRRQVRDEYADMLRQGEPVRLAEIARRCGLYDYRDARRVVRDLEQMGAMT